MSRWAESMLLWSWQSLLLILAIVVVVRVFRFRSAADRYAFWLIGVVAVAALPAANAFVRTLPPVRIAVQSVGVVDQSISVSSVPATLALPEGEVRIAGEQSDLGGASANFVASDPQCCFVWCCGAQDASSTCFVPSVPIGSRAVSAARLIVIRSDPRWARVGYSEHIHAPVTVGILHPMILLPADIRDWATPEERHAVVLHELAHVERRDPSSISFKPWSERSSSFTPRCGTRSGGWLLERELACDERVLDAGAQPAAYAEILLKVAERSVAKPETYQLAFNASGKTLDRRVSMIFNYRSSISSGSRLIRTARACAVLGLAILLLPQRSVTFEAHPTTCRSSLTD